MDSIPDDPTRFAGEPSPQAIADRAAAIRAGWSPDEFLRRSTHFTGSLIQSVEGRVVETPIVAEVDLRWAARD